MEGTTETPPRCAVPPAVSAKEPAILAFLRDTLALADVELRKLRRDPLELLTRAIQPALWLLIFGQVFGRIKAIPTGNQSYLTFMVPGILAQSVLFIAIFYGISVIWERDLGILQKLLVTPAPRSALVLGKALSAGVRGLSQGFIIYLLAISAPNPSPLRGGGDSGSRGVHHPGLRTVFYLLACGGMYREDAGTLHGCRSGAHHAALFHQQCYLSSEHHAARGCAPWLKSTR